MSDELWSELWCLGQATSLMEASTKRFIEGSVSLEEAEAAATLAEAWRDLACHWADRDSGGEDDEESEDEPVPQPKQVRR